ncbi:iron-containing alcohol dehydrogenase, partial [Streptomyces sp. NPDC057131]
MSSHVLYIPSTNLIGRGCLNEAGEYLHQLKFTKALLVTDKVLVNNGIAEKVINILKNNAIDYIIYDEVKPNPTIANVMNGLQVFQENQCDCIVSVGGGSPQDAAKAIGLMAANGGDLRTYEGVGKTAHKSVPIAAVNTTAGTSSEYTINYVITDEERQVKMVMVDKNSLAAISINDPELMTAKPEALTAATGMDALTHAIEAIVSKGAYRITDAQALAAVEIIFEYLPKAVKNGEDLKAREQMVFAMFLAGVAFN